jgi:nucleotide-binding universal stress UspA family protein
MKNIIIHPTDFSSCAMSALQYAEKLCKAMYAELLLVHAIDLNKLAGYDDSGRSLLSRSKEIEDEARQEISKIGEEIANKGIQSKARIYKGSLQGCLPKLISEIQPKMVVMGTTGAGSFSNTIFGSNTYAMVQSSSAPVLAIPENGEFSLCQNVLLASDLSRTDFNPSILDYLSDLVRQVDAKLELLYVPNESTNGESLEGIIAKLNASGHDDLEIEMAKGVDYIKAIEDYLKGHNTDLFAMIISDKNVLEKFIFGSLSKKMIHHAKMPLLMIPRKLTY